MGRRQIKLWTALAFFLALAVTIWPVAKRIAGEREIQRQMTALEARVDALEAAEKEQQRKLAKWYNYSLDQETPGLRGAYGSILDFGEGMMGILEVSALNLRLPIYHGDAGIVGHDPNSSLPIGGRGNHTVLILSEGYDWAEGLAVYIDCLGERLAYRVESVQVMPLSWSTERPTQAGQALLTLVYDRGNTRTLVRCVRCGELTVRETEQSGFLGEDILAAASPLVLIFPALLRCKRYAGCEQTPRFCGFYRKNRGKTKLF